MGPKYSKCLRNTKFRNTKSTVEDSSTEVKDKYSNATKSNISLSEGSDNFDNVENFNISAAGVTDPIPALESVDLEVVLNQLFIHCETGSVAAIHHLFERYQNLDGCVNDRHVCYVSNTYMELTPLQLSAACGHGNVITELLSFPSISCNIPEPLHLMTALHLAVTLGQTLSVTALCKDPRVDINSKNIDGKTALHLAIELEDTCTIETILHFRPSADLRIKDFDGNSSLHFAALYPNEKVLSLLLAHAARENYYCHRTAAAPSKFSLDTVQSKRIFFSVFTVNLINFNVQVKYYFIDSFIELKALNSAGETAQSILKKFLGGNMNSPKAVVSPLEKNTKFAFSPSRPPDIAVEKNFSLDSLMEEINKDGEPVEASEGEVGKDIEMGESKLGSPCYSFDDRSSSINTPSSENRLSQHFQSPSEVLMSSLRCQHDKELLLERAAACLSLLTQASYVSPSSAGAGQMDEMTTFGWHTTDSNAFAQSRDGSENGDSKRTYVTACSWSPRSEMLMASSMFVTALKRHESPLSIEID